MSENTVKGGKNSTMPYAVVEDVTCEPIHSKYHTCTPNKTNIRKHILFLLFFLLSSSVGVAMTDEERIFNTWKYRQVKYFFLPYKLFYPKIFRQYYFTFTEHFLFNVLLLNINPLILFCRYPYLLVISIICPTQTFQIPFRHHCCIHLILC